LAFTWKENVTWKVILAFGSALVLLFVLVGLFLLNLVLGVHSATFPAFAGISLVFGGSAVGYGVSLLRRPLMVVLDGQGMLIEGLIGRKSIEWGKIAEVRRAQTSPSWMVFYTSARKRRVLIALTLLDERKRKLAVFTSDFPEFESLAAEITARSTAARGAPTYDREKHVAEILKRQKASRLTFPAIGVFLVVIGSLGMHSFYGDYARERRMREEGIVVEATVVRLWKHNVTPWVEYAYESREGGSHSGEAMMQRGPWEGLSEGDTIRVRYDPHRPADSELVSGGQRRPNGPFGLMLICVVLVTGIGALAIVLALFGICDIKVSKGKVKFVRYGEIEEGELLPGTSGAAIAFPAEPPPPSPRPGAPQPARGPADATEGEPPQAVFPPAKPPRGIVAFAVLNLVFGIYGLLLHTLKVGLTAWIYTEGFSVETGGGGVLALSPETGEFLLSMAQHSAGFLLAGLLTVSALGLFRFRFWGARLALLAAWGQVVLGVLVAAGRLFFQSIEGFGSEEEFAFNVGRAFSVFLVLLGMVYPIVVIAVLGRRSTKQVFPDYGPMGRS